MPKRKYNHKPRITGTQTSNKKAILPGMIVTFRYTGKDIFDMNPIVLVLFKEITGNKLLHGINLNYLTDYKVTYLFRKLSTNSQIIFEDPEVKGKDIDDTLPNRNLLREPYTRVKLPTFKEPRGGDPSMAKSTAARQSRLIYEKIIKKFVLSDYDVYRTYKIKNISQLKVVKYRI